MTYEKRPRNLLPKTVAQISDVTFTSLTGLNEAEDVAIGTQGILKIIKKGSAYVD